MKIAIFSGYFPPHLGGVERYSDKLADALQVLGHEVVIVTSNDSDEANHVQAQGRSIYRLPILSMARSRYPIPRINTEYKQLIHDIRSEGIDAYIVNTRFHLTSFVGARMGSNLKKPVFLIEHGTAHFTVNNTVLDFFGKIYEHILSNLLKRYVTKYYGVSQNCNKWSKHFGIEASGVFYNAVDPNDVDIANDSFYKKYDDSQVIITYAGRLIKEKGVGELIDAFKKLTHTNIRLVIAGDGPFKEELMKSASGYKVDFLGRLNFTEVISLFKRTNIFVYPSHYPEGLPTSILEAGLMQCAIIATPRGGTAEVIEDGDYGILVDGSTDSLQEALNTLIGDPSLVLKQGKNVEERIKRVFSWKAVGRTVDKEIKAVS